MSDCAKTSTVSAVINPFNPLPKSSDFTALLITLTFTDALAALPADADTEPARFFRFNVSLAPTVISPSDFMVCDPEFIYACVVPSRTLTRALTAPLTNAEPDAIILSLVISSLVTALTLIEDTSAYVSFTYAEFLLETVFTIVPPPTAAPPPEPPTIALSRVIVWFVSISISISTEPPFKVLFVIELFVI